MFPFCVLDETWIVLPPYTLCNYTVNCCRIYIENRIYVSRQCRLYLCLSIPTSSIKTLGDQVVKYNILMLQWSENIMNRPWAAWLPTTLLCHPIIPEHKNSFTLSRWRCQSLTSAAVTSVEQLIACNSAYVWASSYVEWESHSYSP